MIELKSIDEIQGLVCTVMGLGRYKQGSGVGASKWLMRHGAQLVITDLKDKEELQSSVDLVMEWYKQYREEYPDREIYSPVFVLGEHRDEDFTNVQLVVKNPDVPGKSKYVEMARENDIRVESDVSLFFHFYKHPIYTVTGTRGKSTTTTLLGEMLKTKNEKTVIGGNIMHSPLEDLDWLLKEEAGAPVALELSSWLLESLDHIDTGPEIAIWTNISKDHLDRYESWEDYVAAKAIMFKNQTENQFSIVNFDDEVVKAEAEKAISKTYWFSTKELPEDKEGAWMNEGGDLIFRMNGEERTLCNVKDWKAMQGEHNQANAMAAALGASLAGVEDAQICATLKEFEGLDGRQQTVREFSDVTYINDTCASTPTAAIQALKRFGDTKKKHIVLITGGKAKGFESDFPEYAKLIQKTCKHVVYLEGSHTNLIEEAVGKEVGDSHASSMKEAVELAKRAAEEGDVVLLSPAGSSFDLFQNEFDRGGQFVEEVKNLK